MENTNQKQIVVVQSTKSVGLAIVLALFFGPLGMLYSTIPGGLIMIGLNLIAFFLTAGIGVFITWPVGIMWAAVAANSHNKKLTGV